MNVPELTTFGELPDGAYFIPALAWAYGSKAVYQKTLEDGDNHNAMSVQQTNITCSYPDTIKVIEIKPEV